LSKTHPGDSAIIDKSADSLDWIIRPFRDEDVAGMTALSNSVYKHYNIPLQITEAELRARLSGPRTDPQRHYVVAEGPGLAGAPPNMPVGYGGVHYQEDEAAGERMYFLRVLVHQSAEGLGLERALAARLLDIIRRQQADPDMQPLPRTTVKAWSFEHVHPLRELWSAIGLHEVRQFWTMARPLNEPIDEPGVIEGVTIRPYNYPEDNDGARKAFDASFSDHWDHHPTSSEDWEHWLKQPQVRPDLSILAEIDGKAGIFAGFCIIEIFEERNKLRGVSEGWIELLGTIRGWRRMGLGRAILLHGLHSLRTAGMDTALLGVDSESPTGANRLYESVGFRIRSREFSYACDLEEVRI
jgi:mycothiol synthase